MMRAFFVHPGFVRRGIGCPILALSEAGASAAGFKKIEIIATLPGDPFCSTFSYVSVERFYITPPSGAAMPVERMRKHFAPGSPPVQSPKSMNRTKPLAGPSSLANEVAA